MDTSAYPHTTRSQSDNPTPLSAHEEPRHVHNGRHVDRKVRRRGANLLPDWFRASGSDQGQQLARRVLLVARWGITMLVALGAALIWLTMILHMSQQDLWQVSLWLGISGIASLVLGTLAFGLADRAHIGSARVKFVIPSILAALVVGLNTIIAARMMFITIGDAQMLIAFLIFGESVALVVSSSVVATLVQSLRMMMIGVRQMAEGEYAINLDVRQMRLAECADLARHVNVMAERLRAAFAQRDAAEQNRRQVIAAISHDLRTPLTVMRAMLEAIDDGIVTDPATIQRYQHSIRAEIQHLSLMLDDLFEVSRIEAGAIALHREPVDVADILSDLVAAVHEQAIQHAITISGSVASAVPLIEADAKQLYRVCMNLVQNGLRHTPPGGQITLTLDHTPDAVVIEVIDTGEGITPEDLPHIFEPAYRGATARQRTHAESPLEDSTARWMPEPVSYLAGCGPAGLERHKNSSGEAPTVGVTQIREMPPHAAPGKGEMTSGAGFGLAIARGLVEAHGGELIAISPWPTNRVVTESIVATDNAGMASDPPAHGTLMRLTLPIHPIKTNDP